MRKRKYWIVITVILLGLTACGRRVADDGTTNQGDIEKADPFKTEMETSVEEEEKTEVSQTDKSERVEIYRAVLKDIYTNHSFPGGTDYGFDEQLDSSENQFAVFDIDQDGKEELIVRYTTTAMAGMTEKIYDIDSSTNTVIEEFSEFPDLTYYKNGIIKADWSHNQGLAGEFWPYTLYQYDKESDKYVQVGMVDAWNKSLSETDYEGNSFPEDADKDGDGIVYYIMLDGNYALDKPVDLEEYNQWYESYAGDAEEADIPFMPLNEENVNGMK